MGRLSIIDELRREGFYTNIASQEKVAHHRMLLPQPAIDVEHAKFNFDERETYVFPLPKETQGFLATCGTAPLRETRRRSRLDVYLALHFDSRSCQERLATGESFPLGDLKKLLSIYIEECNSKVPSFSSFIVFIIRPVPTTNKLEKGNNKQVKKYPFRPSFQPSFPSLECLYQHVL